MEWSEASGGVPGALTPDNVYLQRVKEFLEHVNGTINEGNDEELVSWKTAVKFLTARKYDVKRAIELYKNYQTIRKEEGINEVCPYLPAVRKELLSEKFTILPGCDKHGATIALFTARLHLPHQSKHKSVLQALMFQLDTALDSTETQNKGLTFIYDMSSSKYKNFDYELSLKILKMLQGSYPARLCKVLIVTAPLWFKAPYELLRVFVREKFRDRVSTLNTKQLPLHIPLSVLPRKLGGEAPVSHREWLQTCLKHFEKNQASDHVTCIYHSHSPLTESSPGLNQTLSSAHDKVAFFDNWDTEDALDASISSSMNSSSITVDNDDTMFVNSSELSESSDDNDANMQHTIATSTKYKRTNSTNSVNSLTNNIDDVPCKRPTTDLDHAMIIDHGASIHNSSTTGNTIQELMVMVNQKRRLKLYQEYQSIKAEPPAGFFEISRAKHNLCKNRYTDVLCFDHSRVCLKHGDGDYINANLVDGYKQQNAFISTQGPLPGTFQDFWQMVWEQRVGVVVMTTRTAERGRTKCGQYWPLEGEGQYGLITVQNKSKDNNAEDYVITSLHLINDKGEERDVTHIQFIRWPDYGVPKSAKAFLSFMAAVREQQAAYTKSLGTSWTGHPNGPPVVIHCSAGIGRTGTFITMDICTKRLADIQTVNVRSTVELIRSQRAFSIQMPDQYVFIHLALLEWSHQEGLLNEVNLDGFYSDSDSD